MLEEWDAGTSSSDKLVDVFKVKKSQSKLLFNLAPSNKKS